MKVAICFAGIPYYIKQNEAPWLKIKKEYNADVFASLWDEENVYQDGDTIEYFKQVYDPVKLEVENQKAFIKSFNAINEEYLASPSFFDEPKHFAHINGRPYSTLYKIWRANLLASEGEYDVVVRAETCSSYPDMEIVKNDNISLPYWHHVYHYGGYNTVNMNNWVAFGPPYLMDYYCSCFLKLRKYYDECLIQPIESFFNHHLLQRKDLQLRFFFSRIYRKGVLNWNGGKYNDKVVLPSPWIDWTDKLGSCDEMYADEAWTGKDTFDTRIEGKAIPSENLHKMAKEPIKITQKRGYSDNMNEFGYQNKHDFSAEKKASQDFSSPTKDEAGNWLSEDNWIKYDSSLKKYVNVK